MEAFEIVTQSAIAMLVAKSTVLLTLALSVTFLLRTASASSRHYVWVLTFVSLLALPIASYLSRTSPSFRIGVPVLTAAAPPASLEAPVRPRRSSSTARESAASSSAPREEGTALVSKTVPTWKWLWALGSALVALRLGAGLIGSIRARRASRTMTEPAWQRSFFESKERIGVERAVDLRVLPKASVPVTHGVWRATILLPPSSTAYSAERRFVVLLHELAHIRRHDVLTQWVGHAVCAVFWWHPLVWVAARKMRAESERASDDLVLHAGTRPGAYAHDLLDMAKGLRVDAIGTPVASVSMAHRSRLEERLLAILDDTIDRRGIRARVAVASAFASALVFIAVSLATPTRAIATSIAAPTRALAQTTRESEPAKPAQPERAEAPESAEEPQTPESPEKQEALRRVREALAEALDDPDPGVREQTVDALSRLGDELAIPHLEEALESTDASIRAQAAWGLGRLRAAPSSSALERLLSDEDDEVREQAAWSLGMIRSETSVDALGTLLAGDSSADARSQAAWALGMIRSESAVETLGRALDDADAEVRAESAWALGMIRDAGAVASLTNRLTDPEAEVRSQAAWALGMIRDAGAASALANVLTDEDADVREQAIWALGMLRSANTLEPLIAALGDAQADIRSQAAWALGMLRDLGAVDALIAATRDENSDVREQALWALGQLAADSGHGHDDGDDPNVDVELGELDIDVDDLDVEVGDPDVDVGDRPRPDPRGASL